MEIEHRIVVAGGCGKRGMGSWCFMGTQFQLGKMQKKTVLEDLVFVSIENYSRKEQWNFKVIGNVQEKKNSSESIMMRSAKMQVPFQKWR